ncbi:hypothetical protein FGG08_001924 [Glutinoglossum americanum]|uniref:Uncharacterized protein n=1 Tax=Glutinoglossum americanum TaxID=1670608 RepID=A0A9P8IAJ8_9PEZI|nr:hypothetical protein FGG08_001924 [Glutinoglossum americanum]
MIEPFPLILPDKRPTTRDFRNCNQKAPSKLTPWEDAHDCAPEGSFQHAISTDLCNSPASRSPDTFLDMGMFPPENKDLQAVYLQVRGEDEPNCTDCSYSQPGSPCEEICIFEDYAVNKENSPDPFVVSGRLSCALGSEGDAIRTPTQRGASISETEDSWLAGQTSCYSWLDDSSSCRGQEYDASQTLPVRRRQPRVSSWVSDSSGASYRESENSFQYATALAPSRPKMIHISSPPSSEDISGLAPESLAQASQLHSNSQPISPPTTPTNEWPLRTDSGKTSIWGTSGRLDCFASLHTSGNPTPPTTPERIYRPLTMMSKEVPMIISMLEDAARLFPSTMLQLHTTPITLIRTIPPPHLPPSTVAQPHQLTLLSLPHLIRSGLPTQPASSARPLPVSNPHQNTVVGEAAAGITIFRQIFSSNSNSTDFLLAALYAHIIALNFLGDLAATPFEHPPLQFPPKALSTLGAIELVEGQGQLYDRVVKVSAVLKECAGRLLETCSGRSRLDETLLKALREIVRLVESRNGRGEHF